MSTSCAITSVGCASLVALLCAALVALTAGNWTAAALFLGIAAFLAAWARLAAARYARGGHR